MMTSLKVRFEVLATTIIPRITKKKIPQERLVLEDLKLHPVSGMKGKKNH